MSPRSGAASSTRPRRGAQDTENSPSSMWKVKSLTATRLWNRLVT